MASRSAYSWISASTVSFARGIRRAPPRMSPRRPPRPPRPPVWRSIQSQQPEQEGLLGVHAVLGLIPDGGLRAVDHLVGDLLAPVCRQAVQDDRVRCGEGEEAGVDAIRP